MIPAVNRPMSQFDNNAFTHKVLTTSLNGIYVHDVNMGRNVYINRQYTVLTGYTCEDLHAMDKDQFSALFHPADRPRVIEHMRKIAQFKTNVLEIEYRFRTKDGRWIWCLSRDSVFAVDRDGRVAQFIGFFLDITEKRQFETQEKRQRELMQGIFDTIPVLLVIWNPQLNRFTLNRHAETLLGWTTEEANQIDFMRAVFPDEAYRNEVIAFMRSLEPHWRVWSITTRDGGCIPIDWTKIRLADDTMIGIGVVQGERKQAEQPLTESEARFSTMADGLSLIFWVNDAQGRQLFANRTFNEFFGIPAEEIVEDRWQARMHPDDAQAYTDDFLASVRERRIFHAQVRIRRADGQWGWMQSWGTPRFSPQGDYLGHVGAGADITELKQAESVLKRSKEDLERTVRERTFEIEIKNRRLEQMNQMVKKMARLNIRAMEHDRKALSKEIHDSIGGNLSAIKMLLETRLHEFEHPPSDGLMSFEEIIGHLSDIIKESKRISFQIRSLALDDFGLQAAMREAVKKFKEFYPHIAVEEKIVLDSQDFSDEIKTAVYRIIEEALNNIGKHSGADTARIELQRVQNRIRLKIEDNGRGFDTASVFEVSEGAIHGFGMQSMKERAEIFGGTFDLVSVPGKGTLITVSIPLTTD